MYERITQNQVEFEKSKLTAAKVNKDVKPSLNMIPSEISYTITLFMTTSPCVISAGAARETLFEGKADYCMIVCE